MSLETRGKMTANELTFPVVCFHRHLLRVRNDWDALVTTTTAGVKNGMFDNMLVVDSSGKAIRVKSARKLHGVGLFWGFNPMVGRRIKVELVYDGDLFPMTVDEVRNLVLGSFKNRHGWQTRGDFDELKAAVEKASTVAEIIRLVTS
jgi:hypothetical protein